jgi:ribonuclease BN (tRNA processing enzyme)
MRAPFVGPIRRIVLLIGLTLSATCLIAKQVPPPIRTQTKIVFLGTGTPVPSPDRSGPSSAIVVNDTAYLVDFGAGVVRRANEAYLSRAIKALEPRMLRVAFVTHLHTDHTVGYADLIFTPWTIGRRIQLEVYGPKGIKRMTEHLTEAYREDIDTRTSASGQEREYPDGHKVKAIEIAPGIVYRDANVTVTAFATKHALESYGYRFETADRSIVISGDTNPTQATVDACRGCDVLVHEAQPFLATRSAISKEFGAAYHTSPAQLAELARRAKPGLLIIYHQSGGAGTDGLFDDMRRRYTGHFIIARDLDVF